MSTNLCISAIWYMLFTGSCCYIYYLKMPEWTPGCCRSQQNLHAGSPFLRSHWDQFLCTPKTGELILIPVTCNSMFSGWKEDCGSTISPSGKGNVQQAQSTSRLTTTSQAVLTTALILTSRWVIGAQILSVTDRTTRHQNTLLARHVRQWWKEMKVVMHATSIFRQNVWRHAFIEFQNALLMHSIWHYCRSEYLTMYWRGIEWHKE